ncbi:MAG: FG-GAP repeat protein [Caldilineaceae bacterium]
MYRGNKETLNYRVATGDFNADGLTDLVTVGRAPSEDNAWLEHVFVDLSQADRFDSQAWRAVTPQLTCTTAAAELPTTRWWWAISTATTSPIWPLSAAATTPATGRGGQRWNLANPAPRPTACFLHRLGHGKIITIEQALTGGDLRSRAGRRLPADRRASAYQRGGVVQHQRRRRRAGAFHLPLRRTAGQPARADPRFSSKRRHRSAYGAHPHHYRQDFPCTGYPTHRTHRQRQSRVVG